jgi:mono/diheme cytochrome c family protein
VNPAHFFGEAGPSRVHAAVSLPAPGDQSYRVIVRDAATGAPRSDVQKVFVSFGPPGGSGLATERVELEAQGTDGVYGVHGAHTPVVGEWTLEVIVRRVGERDEMIAFRMPVSAASAPIPAPTPDAGLGVPAPLAVLWGFLPSGPLGWLPGPVALVAVIAFGRGRIASGRWAPLKLAVVALAAIAVLAAGSRAVVDVANRPTAAGLAVLESAPSAGSAENGERIYLANCASCHGINGDGNGPVGIVAARPLSDALRAMSDGEVSYRIVNGLAGTAMPAFAASLTAQERRDLVTYLRERWDAP